MTQLAADQVSGHNGVSYTLAISGETTDPPAKVDAEHVEQRITSNFLCGGELLFGAQGLHYIDAGSPSRWQQRRDNRNCHQQERGDNHRQGARHLHVNEKATR